MNKRLDLFKEQFDSLGIDGALVYSDSNRNYLSGFTGNESFAVITKKKAFFITDSRFTEQAQNQVKGFVVQQYANSIYDFIKNLVCENNIKKFGIEEDYMNVLDYDSYKEKLPEVEFVKLNHAIEKLRTVKDEIEIDKISKAAAIADKAFSHMLTYIKPGMKESEVGLELEFYMRKLGATCLSFPSIIASGTRSSLPHGQASDKVLENGDFFTLDFGCVYDGYCSDMTRTVVIGKATEKQKEIYSIVLKANEEAMKGIKAGNVCSSIDKIARDVIKKNGYGDRFGHGLGHGVGMQIHEMPRLSPKDDSKLKAGMVVTDEPGIYIPGFGGVRIEDLVVVTEDGHKVLSNSPKYLIEL